ncbi:MAG: Calx-beta domain-containing protein [Pseudomonadota bacterium]
MIAGKGTIRRVWALWLATVVSCALPHAAAAASQPLPCGKPAINFGADRAGFLWRDCADGSWRFEASPGGRFTEYRGNIEFDAPLPAFNGVSIESTDSLSLVSQRQRLNFVLKVSGSRFDAVRFVLANDTSACFTLTAPTGVSIFGGRQRMPVGRSFDVVTGGACGSYNAAPQVSGQAAGTVEADGIATFRLQLEPASDQEVRVAYATEDGTATDGSDFVGVVGEAVFAPGITAVDVPVSVIDDQVDEGTEVFSLRLSDPINAELAAPNPIPAEIWDTALGSCGRPDVNVATDPGLYLYQTCADGLWNLLAVGGGRYQRYRGRLESAMPFLDVGLDGIEGDDQVDNQSNPLQIDFDLAVTGSGTDRFTFAVDPAVSACMRLASPEPAEFYLGTAVSPLPNEFDVITLDACDDENRPPVLTVANASALESAGTVAFELMLSRPSTEPASVLVSTEDLTATAGADYEALVDQAVVFQPGDTLQPLTVTVLEDAFSESPEGFGLTFSEPINLLLGSQGDVFGTIIDNDQAQPQLQLENVDLGEGTGTAFLRVRSSLVTTTEITFELSAISGTATVGADVLIDPGPHAIPAGETALLVPVQVVDDSAIEGEERFTVAAVNVVGATPPASGPLSLTIADNDAPVCGRPAINAARDSALFVFLDCGSGLWQIEAVGGGRYTAFRGAVTSDVALQNPLGANIENSDSLNLGDRRNLRFELKVSGQGRDILRFRAPAGARVCLDVTAPANPVIRFGPGRTLMPASFDLTTRRGCGDQVVLLDVAAGAAVEGDGSIRFPVTLSEPAPEAVSFRAIASSGSAVVGSDFASYDAVTTLGIGELQGEVVVPLVDDTIRENSESFTLELSELVNASGGTLSAVGQISDDDPLPTLSAPVAITVPESSAAGATVPFTLSNPTDAPAAFRIRSEPVTATAETDYLSIDELVDFAAGVTTAGVQLNLVDDSYVEGDETLNLVLSEPTGLQLGTGAVQIVIADDASDTTVVPALTVQATRTFAEQDGVVQILATLSAPAPGPVEVQVSLVLDGSASSADVALASGPLLAIPTGATEGTISLALQDDALFEASETFSLALANPVNATLTEVIIPLTVLDDDVAPTLALSGTAQATEGGVLNFTAQLDQASGVPVSFELVAVGGSATAGSDYLLEPAVRQIPAGDLSLSVTVPTVDDALVEGEEDLVLALTAVSGALAGPDTVGGSIADNEGLPSVQVSGTSCRFENDPAGLAVELSNPSTAPVTVLLSTGGPEDTALPAADYTAQSDTLVTFAPGETRVVVPLGLVDDSDTEPLEAFSVSLSSPANAELGNTEPVTVTIVDDDLAPGQKSNPGHYISLRRVDGDAEFVDALRPGVAGIQKRYSWAELEPTMDSYDFSTVRKDLDLAACNGGSLVVFLEDKTFASEPVLPSYMINYAVTNSAGGTSPLRWESIFVDRFNLLVSHLAQAFDTHPAFEGVAFQETATGLSATTLNAVGYTPEAYRDALINMLTHAATVLPRSHVFWYMNFFPENQGYIVDVANAVSALGVAVGGPDILPDDPSLLQFTYPLYDLIDPAMVRFGSMQFNSYAHPHASNAPTPFWTPEELFIYGRDELDAQYLFWNRKTWRASRDSYLWLDALPVIEANPVFNQ